MTSASMENHTAPELIGHQVPSFLVREILDGQAIYYKGYRDVLTGRRPFEEVLGDSSEKLALIEYLTRLFLAGPDRHRYRIITNEARLMIDDRNDISGDIQLFDAAAFPAKKEKSPYAVVAPAVHVEVDLNIEADNLTQEEYIDRKTSLLLGFGTARVIWIFTDSKKIIIATREGEQKLDWWEEVALTERVKFNLGEFLQEYEVSVFP